MTEKTADELARLANQSTQQEVLYVRDVDGRFYMEVRRPDGEFDYVKAEMGLAFKELPSGKYMAVRDMAVHERLTSSSSHAEYFGLGNPEEATRNVKQRFKRLSTLERQINQMAVDMVTPSGPDVEYVTDEQAIDLINGYRLACIERRERDSDFIPLSAYQHKLVLSSGKVIRPIFKGEVGMRGSTILVLEAGYGSGSTVQVPK